MSSIALAAQTLGNRTNDATELRELIEAKFVDGLRSVAATMNLEELQEQRAVFVKSVQDAVGADIQNNGLELELVSLTRLDQSDIKHFNPNNFFDAHGLTTLTKITKEREQERNQIVRSTEVNIAQQDLVARQTTLTIETTKRDAELAQQRDIANKTAAMRAQTAQVEQTALQNEAEYRIQQELAVANKQTEANQARDTRKIEADLAVKRRNTEMDRDLQIVAQESAIAVATKSKEQSEAQTIAETARAIAIAAEEKVTTASATEIAERDKTINVIAARKAAETNAMPITVMAEAEKQAAANKAEAINVLAKADANAATTRAGGVKSLGQAEAEVAALKAEARNKLSSAIVDYDLNLARINIIPNALAEAVKPIEKISDIRIFDTGGLLGRGGGGQQRWRRQWRPWPRRWACRAIAVGLGLQADDRQDPRRSRFPGRPGRADEPHRRAGATQGGSCRRSARARRRRNPGCATGRHDHGPVRRESQAVIKPSSWPEQPSMPGLKRPVANLRRAFLLLSGNGWVRTPRASMLLTTSTGSHHVGTRKITNSVTINCPQPSTASPGPISPRSRPSRSRWRQRRSSRCCCSASAKARPACCRRR